MLKEQIGSMPSTKQLEFAVLICKKLFFDYQEFFDNTKWGDPDTLMDAVCLCLRAINNKIDIPEVEEMIVQVDSITPATEDFSDWLGSYAMNACVATSETLLFLVDNNQDHIYTVATYYTDTVDFKIHEENELTYSGINDHPLMIEARNFLLEKTK
ncbi:MAG: DUF416 family protein [Bacteroidetes bacterium]|nr:DUF416 family protein [Bacteroidota bacterium]MBS1932654.1 DUF416 family protein [Bacteroidota bacterium]